MNEIEVTKTLDGIKELIIAYGLKIIMAIVVLIIGLLIIKWLTNAVSRVMERRGVDESLQPFLRSLFNALFKVMLFISVIQMVGVEATSFIAVLGALGLAIGMALSGTLQNFAGGVIILLLKPFKKGDFIDAQGYTGTVNEIQIFATILKTPDNKTVIIPNGPLSTGSLVNFSTESRRRVDMAFGIGYNDDVEKAKSILLKMVEEDQRIIKDPAPFVRVSELADSSVNFAVRVWAEASDYWAIYFDFQENVKKAFDTEGIGIPFPQMDVHVHNN